MEPTPSSHPTDEVLQAYGQGQLAEAPALSIHRHLETCADCRRRVAGLTADSFVGRLREFHNPPAEETVDASTGAGPFSFAGSPLPSTGTLPAGLAEHPDYQIQRELGRGGMGVVYLAHNTMMGRDEVLKVTAQPSLERPGALERFQREIRAVARLRHPNIVTAYSAFRIEGGLVFAMEYVEGLDLARLVKAKGPLSVAHAAYFAYQAALGLQHAHERGLIHRDIKPHNLMLARDGQAQVVKVLDFGLAKATVEQEVDGPLTSEGQALGTPDYIAPEQIVNAPDVDIRADLYSLGGTLFFLLTGRPPFQCSSLYDVFQAHISREAEPLNQIRPEVPTELAALVSKLMSKKPADRFQTPVEVARALVPFFKVAKSTARGPRTEGSTTGRSMVDLGATQSAPDAAPRAVASDRSSEWSAAETRWDSLIDFRENEDESEESTAVEPGRRPPWKSWPIALAASLLGMVALGIIILISFKDKDGKEVTIRTEVDGPTEDVKVKVMKTRDTAGTRPDRSSPARPKDPDPPPARDEAKEAPASAPPTARRVVMDSFLPPATRSVYVDNFDNPESGWPKATYCGYSEGSLFVKSGGGWKGFNSPRQMRTDATLEVVGRVRSDLPLSQGAWIVMVNRPIGTKLRGFQVKINVKGELFLSPNPWPEAKDFFDVDPTIGPIVHPAIKRGGVANTLLIVMKKRSLELYVNHELVCGPLSLTYDLTPSFFSLGGADGLGDFRAEFDRVEIREFTEGRPTVPLTPSESLTASTRLVFVDDFLDPGSGWPVGDGKGYNAGAYFVDPFKNWSAWRSPRRIRTDSVLEVVGRVKSDGPATRGAWGVVVKKMNPAGHRGFVVKINTKGELFLLANPFQDAKDTEELEPAIGPIVHPAIKAGGQSNTLQLVMKKRNLEIFVNSVAVCEPVTYDFDLIQSAFELCADDGPGNFVAEFDKVEIREFTEGRPRVAPTAYGSIERITRLAWFDDFSDPRSKWTKGDDSGYFNGIYFIDPRDSQRYYRAPETLKAEGVIGVVGRLKANGPITRGSWGINLNKSTGTALRGFLVKINAKGELFLEPNHWREAQEFFDIDPTIGPIVHPAINPGGKANQLLLLIKKRSLEIFVNSERVCDPVTFDYDLTPMSYFQLTAREGPSNFRAEFDNLVIRDLIRPSRD